MPTTEYVLENKTHKRLYDFEIQAYHQISARRPDHMMIIKKKKKKKKKKEKRKKKRKLAEL